ncbi:gliding motility-associated-like protein [Flavobacterium sp. 9]|uniref:MBG domain-containing protein n=1 Tax=Flavobacterium sp. 9 TaxID=2035198 RepID=UPI000C18C6DE|nr:MBG domain-containing protein [Flavobacterium sp. 9]PIF29864.1 gliding motility-associated-like protein [Flavobacterium sp. 9]
MNKNILFILVLLLFNFGYGQTNTWTGATSTAWQNGLNWSLGVAPLALHDVVIPAVVNEPVISTSGITCATLTLGAGSNLTINPTGVLSVIGEINFSAPTVDNGITSLNVGAGTLSSGGIVMASGANDTRKCKLNIDTGTANIVGSITMTGSVLQNDVTFTGVGTLNIGGTMTGGSLIPDIGTVNYNGLVAQSVGTYIYHSLTLSGAGIKTFSGAIAVNNTLSIGLGVIADLGAFIHTTFLLSLNGANSSLGTWGGTGSGAINIDPVFFAANNGVLNVGLPTIQATNVLFTNTASTNATIDWTNGNGASRVVFVHAGVGANPLPLNYFAYTANSIFGSGTQIGTSGWYCVYKGTGTTVNITGLLPSTTYQIMVIEFNGSIGNELHLTATSTENPVQVTTDTVSTSTVGPGGVITGLQLWLDASNGATAAGGNLTAWSDLAGINTFAVSATPPTVNNNAVNFHPTVQFNNTNSITTYPATQNLIGNTSITYVDAYGVFKENSSAGGTIIGSSSSGTNYGIAVFTQQSSRMYVASGKNSVHSSFAMTEYTNFHIFNMDTSIAGGTVGSLDGVNQTMAFGNGGNFSSLSVTPTVGTTNNRGNSSGWNHLQGQIAEVVVYNESTALQRLNIQSYLSLKYGIHKTDNYLAGNNTVIWDATANAAYHNDVFGIGQDDLSGLNQVISNSMNTGGGDGTGQSGKGNIVISNPSSLVNNGFLVIGHDTSALTETVIGSIKRVQRIWKVQSTGNPGTVSLSYDITGLTYSAQSAGNYILLVDPTGTGNFNGGSVVKYPGAAITGNKVSFNTVALPTGAVFSFQTGVAPPPIVTNFSPQTGPIGTTVTITGTNFGATIAENIVFFGAAQATVTAASATSLTVTVPAGATYKSISVINTSTVLVGYSLVPFITTFTPNKGNITIDDFEVKVDFSLTNNVTNVVIGDFDRDGKPDLAITDSNASSISILRNISTSGNISTGSFAAKVDFPVGNTPEGICIGDFDNDGKIDLAVTNYNSNTVSIIRNTSSGIGNIAFAASVNLTTDTNPNSIVAHDFDGDGKSDIITGNFNSNSISVFRNTSSGIGNIGFTAKTDLAVGTGPNGVSVGDFDGDNKMDVAVSLFNGQSVSVFRNISTTGIISFDNYISFPVTSSAYNVVVGDLNNDGKPDIACANNTVSVLNNTSSGIGNINFGPKVDFSTVDNIIDLDIGDLDGDGKLDLVATKANGGFVSVLRNTTVGTGSTVTFASKTDFAANPIVRRIKIGDLDGDGKDDIITANRTGNSISILRNNPLFAPTTQATNVVFTATTGTTTTASWANGNGSSRAVFMYAGATGSPLPVDLTVYTANAAFGTGTQIGTSGWYCVYNGTGTAVNITGLNPATIYRVMVVERNGSAGDEMYLSTVGTGNPAGVITLNNVATLSNLTISQGTLTPVFATGTTIYTATVANAVTSLTVTPATTDPNAVVKVDGVTVASGSPSGAIALAVGPNIITTVVTAQDGTTIGTYTITVTRTAPPTIVATGTVAALSTIYGTPSASATFNVSGTDMFAGILVTAPSGFEVSTDNITFTNTVTVGAPGIIVSTPVYIRLKGTTPAGSYLGDVVLSSTGATTVNFAIVSSTVNKAPLTITAADKTKVYGDANPTLTVNYAGFVNGDTSTNLTTLASATTTATANSGIGTYPITPSGAVSSNYTFTYINGNLTITAASLTFTADDKTRVYGAANPTFTGTYNGFVNGDTEASITTPPIYNTTAVVGSGIGDYPITPSGAVSPNYIINYVNGNLSVTKATLTITAVDKTKVYGDANPTLTVTYSGFANGESETDLVTPPTITTTATTASAVGSYPIVASAAVDDNYTFTYVNGNLEITKAALTITAVDKTKVYGDANPTLTVTYSGFANGESATDLVTPPTITTTATTASAVGSYPIVASAAVDDNYTFTYVNGNLEITKAALTITAVDKTKVYGDANPTLTVTYSGFANGESETDLVTPPTITTTATTASAVGLYPIVASAAVDDNYTFTYVNGNLEITKAALTITAVDKTKVYGDANPTLTVTYSGFANGESATDLVTQPTITTTATTASAVGSYPIVASAAVDDNYAFIYVNGNLEITKAALTITAVDKTKVYGDANPTLTVTYSGFTNGESATDLVTQPTITTTATTASAVGSYPIVASAAVDDNYTFTYVNGNLEITKAALTITAVDKTKVYGDANPTLTVTYSGFANGESATDLVTQPTITTTATTASAVGSYPIVASAAVDDNYTFTYVNGNLEITKAALTITAVDKTKVYGDANPTLTVTYSGFANGESETDLVTQPTIATTATTASAVGSYPIVASAAADDNYTFTYVNGNLDITKAALTITAVDKTKVYGDANPTLTVTYSGFANGESATDLVTPPTITTTAIATSPVGTYPITASGAASTNYTFTYVAGSLAVTPVTLTITADNQTKVYGDANPTLTVTYSGFANGESATDLLTLPTITTTAIATSPVGTYPITASGAASTNYTFSYVAGSLAVTPVTLTITADNQTKVYGDANPALTVTYSGFVNGDSATSLTTAPTITTTAIATSPVGTYPITASGAASTNYTFSYVAGSLAVTPVTLTITADNQTKVYGDANPALTVTYSGFVNGDSATSLTTAPTITTTAIATSPVGTYPITASGAASTNYTFTYVAGSLAVTPVTLTITADNQTKVYGDANPALTVTYSGFVNGDSATSLTTAPTITTTATVTSPVGTYPITASGAASTNYTFSYVAGSLAVTPVTLTITANNQTKVYGDANPTLTVTYSGFVNGDSATSLTTAPTITTTAIATSPVGTYPITASGAVSTNYTFSYVAGSLAVTPVTLTITADNQTKVYGDVNPTLTVTYSGFVNGDSATSLTTAPTITTTAIATSPVGTYPITASGAASTNYTFSYVAGNLEVTKAVLTITADNKTKSFGDVNPTLTATYSGFANGDTQTSLTTLATITTTAITTSPVGLYPITATGAVSVNYSFSYVSGVLEVLPLTDALLTNLSISQGTLTPVFAITTKNYTATVANAITSLTVTPVTQDADATVTVNGVPVISGNASGAIALAVGTNTITTIVTAQDGITTETYTVVVTRTAPPTIVTTGTLSALTTTYGTASTSGTFNVSGSDMLAGILVTAPSGFEVSTDNSTFTNTVTVGTLGIIASTPVYIRLKGNIAAGSYSGDIVLTSNNALTVNVATISSTVSPATLTVTADDKTKVYGDANPTLTVSYAGFVNGDTVTSLTTAPSVSTTALLGSGVGFYPITATGAVNPNYTFTYVNGNLLINTASLTVTADNQTKTYGSANPTFTVAYSGFVNGDTETVLLIPATVTTTADTSSPVGVYPLTVSGAIAVNYTMSFTTGSTLTITKAALTITADDKNKVYGDANPALTVTYSGFANGESATDLVTQPTITTTATTASAVGSYPIVASAAVDDNYAFTYVNGNLEITKAALTITAVDKTKIYGDANPALTVTYSGFTNGESETDLVTQPTITTTATTASAVGSYPIVASAAVDDNYAFTYVNGNLAVTTSTLTITADDQSKTYGSANPSLTASYTGFVNGDTSASLDTPATLSTIAVTGSPVGSYPIVASGALDSNYTITFVNGNLALTTATLTITADDQTKTYGSANPALTASYTGFVNGDTAASLDTPATLSTIAVAGSPVGSYPIVASGALDSNYTITFVNGNLAVTTATLTITADDKTKTYGSANPALTASYTGFVNGDTAASLDTPGTLSTIAVTGSPVGSYPIVASGALDSNYTITFVNGNLAVTKATLTITADDQTKTYGSANPTLTASYTGFVNGDTAASLDTPATLSTIAVAGSPVGSYPIVASGALDSNYTITFVNGNLAVTTATLTITADDKSKTYGSANPALTASYTGFVNGDTSASLDTPATLSTIAVTGSPVGSYPIVASGALDSNYTITFVKGNLAVTTATLTITADDKSKTYGSANPALTASYSGFVNGDTSASLDTPTVLSTIANTTSSIGSYPIVASGAIDSNYAITFVSGVLTVTPSVLSNVNLASLSINSGLLNPAFSPDTLLYNVNVGNDIHTETITVSSEDPLATIKINGITIVNGGSLTPVSLVTGINKMVVTVTSPDGLVTKTYILNIIKASSDIATLSNLSISNGVLEPAFESDVKDYTAAVKYDVASITVIPIVTDLNAHITVNGVAVANATASTPIPLNPGENIIKTVVTAEDGTTTETYTITVYKAVAPDKVTANNILSPNGDGKNDFWEIKDILLYPNNSVTVYDRAGRIVYSKKSYSNDWGGLFDGSPLNNDTYYYLIDLGDALPKIKGFITIIRD